MEHSVGKQNCGRLALTILTDSVLWAKPTRYHWLSTRSSRMIAQGDAREWESGDTNHATALDRRLSHTRRRLDVHFFADVGRPGGHHPLHAAPAARLQPRRTYGLFQLRLLPAWPRHRKSFGKEI